jgi:hypothetical protein
MVKYFLLILTFYFLLRFIFNFVVPVVATALKMRRKIKEMQSPMNSNSDNYGPSAPKTEDSKSPSKASSSDYIDFEEVR